MKKSVIVILLLASLAFLGSMVFSAVHITEVPIKAEIQRYDFESESFEEAIVIQDEHVLTQLVRALNEAKFKTVVYEVARFEDYKVTLFYEDGMADTIRIWLDFDQDYDMFLADTKDGSFHLRSNEARETLRKILK